MILAIDPGLATLGWAVLDTNGAVHDVGVFTSKSNAKRLGKNADRVLRLQAQARELDGIMERWREHLAIVVAEAMSFPRGRTAAIISLCLSWGTILGLAQARGLAIRQVPPKKWQRAIVPTAFAGDAIDYDRVFAELLGYVAQQDAYKLVGINKSDRTHALDAVGVGVYAAMTPAIERTKTFHGKRRRRA